MIHGGIGDDAVVHPRGFHPQLKIPGRFLVNFQVGRRHAFIPVQCTRFVAPGDIGIDQQVVGGLVTRRELGQESVERTFDTGGVCAGRGAVEIILVVTELGADGEFFREVELQRTEDRPAFNLFRTVGSERRALVNGAGGDGGRRKSRDEGSKQPGSVDVG